MKKYNSFNNRFKFCIISFFTLVFVILNIVVIEYIELFLYLSIIIFIITIIVMNLIIKKVTDPIKTIAEGFKMISSGDMSFRINTNTNDKFAFLANNFNEMSGTLENMIKELEETQKNLEKQVKDRTSSLQEANKKLEEAMAEIKRTQLKTIQIEKQKSLTDIVAGFAHEINNPLGGIMGYVELIQLKDDTSPYIKEKLANIKKQTIRIKNIIDDVKQINPERDQTKFEIDLSNLLEKLLKIKTNKKENHLIHFEKQFADNNIIVFGNHFALWQIFEYIIDNSIEAINEKTTENGKIEIILKKSIDNTQSIVEIIDNGGGFKNIEKAFDPFFTTKKRTQKKGIGLSIAYNLIQEHNGNIFISNYEKGAKVTIYLPLINENRPISKT